MKQEEYSPAGNGPKVSSIAAVDECCTENTAAPDPMADLERRIAELEAAMGDLRSRVTDASVQASAAVPAVAGGRKTIPSSTAAVLAKQGVTLEAGSQGAALDEALRSLPVEQRIAVKSQMLRSGLL